MPIRHTEIADFSIGPNPNGLVDAVDLVLAHPGSTLGELVLLSADEAALDDNRHEAGRLALLPFLYRAAASGALITGPRRECGARRVVTSTWLPGDPMAGPLKPAPGLRGLFLRAQRLILGLAAIEVQA